MSIVSDLDKCKPYQPHECIPCAHVADYYRWCRDQPQGDRLPNQIFWSAYWSWSCGTRPYGY